MPRVLAQLRGPRFRQVLHVVLCAEVQTAGRTGLDACRFETLPHTVRAQRALVNLLRLRIELRNIERATGNAVLAADAVILLEIDNAIGVLYDGAVGGTRTQATWIGAVHALVLAH